ncbi:MAG: hypothetical protein Q8P80_03015 [Candidatus Levybacteria bacterium]|nr:hypothetical protein [Candidatus Levybacteria bacterium]
MNAENILTRILEVKADRRGFLKGAGKAGLTIAGSALIPAVGLGSIFYIPEKSPIALEEGKEIFPGWIEKGISKPFIQKEKGHFPWLSEAVFNNPILYEGTRDFMSFLNENKKQGKRLSLTEALLYPIEKMNQRFSNFDKSKISNKINPEDESLRVAIFVFAAGFMPWFSEAELENFGVNLAGYKDKDDYFVGQKGVERNVFPKLFKDLQSGRVINGQDRAVHFAQHLLIVFEYLYSNYAGLKEHELMPPLLKVSIDLTSDGTLPGKAMALSGLLGLGWEYLSLLDAKNLPIFASAEIEEGPFDAQVSADYKANRLGARTAIAFFGAGTNEESRKVLFAELNKE